MNELLDIFTKKYFVCYTKEIKYEINKNSKEFTITKFNCSVSKDLETAMKKKEEREQKYDTPNKNGRIYPKHILERENQKYQVFQL